MTRLSHKKKLHLRRGLRGNSARVVDATARNERLFFLFAKAQDSDSTGHSMRPDYNKPTLDDEQDTRSYIRQQHQVPLRRAANKANH